MRTGTDKMYGKVLKLTPQSQYGILLPRPPHTLHRFEVDSTESIWYIRALSDKWHARVLKLTPQSQYGI